MTRCTRTPEAESVRRVARPARDEPGSYGAGSYTAGALAPVARTGVRTAFGVMWLSGLLVIGCYEKETSPPDECNEAGVCGGRCVDIGAPIADFVYVLVEDESGPEDDGSGHPGTDLCRVALECDGRLEPMLEMEWRRGDGVICDEQVVSPACPPDANYADPSVLLDGMGTCGREDIDGTDGVRILALGVGGRLLVRYARPVVGCRLYVFEWLRGADFFRVEYCTGPPEAGGTCSSLASQPGGRDGLYSSAVDDPSVHCD